MLGLGRGRWAVSQKHTLIRHDQSNLVPHVNLLPLGCTCKLVVNFEVNKEKSVTVHQTNNLSIQFEKRVTVVNHIISHFLALWLLRWRAQMSAFRLCQKTLCKHPPKFFIKGLEIFGSALDIS